MDVPTVFKFSDTGLTRFIPEDMTDECPICTLPYSDKSHRYNKIIVRLPCQHNFHRHCIVGWLMKGESDLATCPNCRLALCTRPELTNENTARSLIRSPLEDWAAERAEGIWAASEESDRLGLRDIIEDIVVQVIDTMDIIVKQALEDAQGEIDSDEILDPTAGLQFASVPINVFNVAYGLYQKKMAVECPVYVHPGSVGQFVTARTMIWAIGIQYVKRGWDHSFAGSALWEFARWENKETTTIEEFYRERGLSHLAKLVKKEMKRTEEASKEALQIFGLLPFEHAIVLY